MKSYDIKKTTCMVLIAGALLLCACGAGKDAGASGEKGQAQHSAITPLENSFVVMEGSNSCITCMAMDKKGNVYAAGFSDYNCVIFKLDSELKSIQEMVKFGGSRDLGYHSQDTIKDMAIDSQGNVFVAGYTQGIDFPVTRGCFDGTMALSGMDYNFEGFVTKFSPDLKLLASTFIGADNTEKAFGIAIDKHDDIYVAGFTTAGHPKFDQPLFTTPGAYDRRPAPDGQSKAFVVKLSNDLSTLRAGTLLGGNQSKMGYECDDEAYDIAIDDDGHIWVVGQTNSYDFPVTPGSLGQSYAGKGDIFISKFDADLSRLLASAYLGGMNQEMALSIVLDKKGNAFVGGWTESPDLPMVAGCYDEKYSHEEEDGFVVKVSSDLTELQAATFIGGDYDASGYGDDLLSSMALSDNGKILCVAGRTESENFPVSPKCYKNYTNDSDTAFFGQHRNSKKPREFSTEDKDYGDGFIALFDSDLTQCQYATYLGGDDLEYVDDILFSGKNLLVSGETHSHEFPRITTKDKHSGSKGFAILFDWKHSR
jgi:hypothetical protein